MDGTAGRDGTMREGEVQSVGRTRLSVFFFFSLLLALPFFASLVESVVSESGFLISWILFFAPVLVRFSIFGMLGSLRKKNGLEMHYSYATSTKLCMATMMMNADCVSSFCLGTLFLSHKR